MQAWHFVIFINLVVFINTTQVVFYNLKPFKLTGVSRLGDKENYLLLVTDNTAELKKPLQPIGCTKFSEISNMRC